MQLKGQVKWFDEKKGFGFLTCESVQGDIFVHYKNILGKGFKTLQPLQNVSFKLVETEKGYQATDVLAEKVTKDGE